MIITLERIRATRHFTLSKIGYKGRVIYAVEPPLPGFSPTRISAPCTGVYRINVRTERGGFAAYTRIDHRTKRRYRFTPMVAAIGEKSSVIFGTYYGKTTQIYLGVGSSTKSILAAPDPELIHTFLAEIKKEQNNRIISTLKVI